jgi:ubiquinone/menaquinone biosynthesis C-methylase UbiE
MVLFKKREDRHGYMRDSNTQTHFDSIAGVYDYTIPVHIQNHYCSKRIRLLSRFINGGWVCSLGGGTGYLEQQIQKNAPRIASIDLSFAMCRQGLNKGLRHVICADAAALPIKNARVSLCYSVATFHHLVEEKRVASAIAEMHRITCPGGTMVIWDHNPINPWWRFVMKKMPQDHVDTRIVGNREFMSHLRQLRGTLQHFRSGWMPEFVPAFLLPLARCIEAMLEKCPIIKNVSAHNVYILTRERSPHA